MAKEFEHPEMIAAVEKVAGVTPNADLHFTKEEEDRIWRKLDYRLLPLVFTLYTLSVLDRSNLGNAKLAGLEKSIDLKGWNYNWLGTAFYLACMIPDLWCSAADSLTHSQTSSFNGLKWVGRNSHRISTAPSLLCSGDLWRRFKLQSSILLE